MILLLWGLIAGLIVGGILLFRKGGDTKEEAGLALTITGIFAAIIFLIICIAQPLVSGSRAAQYTAFYEANYSNYGVVIDETASYLSSEDFAGMLIAGSIEKFDLAGVISERIKEWRDSVNQYNLDIARHRFYSTHPIVGILHPNLPDHVQTLTLTNTGES